MYLHFLCADAQLRQEGCEERAIQTHCSGQLQLSESVLARLVHVHALMHDAATTNGATRCVWCSALSDAGHAGLRGQGTCARDRLVVDVAANGAGIAGLSVAYHLVQAGRSVAVFHKGRIGREEPGRTTAHLASALDEHCAQREKLHGLHWLHGARVAGVDPTDTQARTLRGEPLRAWHLCCVHGLQIPANSATRSGAAAASRPSGLAWRARTGRSQDARSTVTSP